jgi:hypothetical protein
MKKISIFIVILVCFFAISCDKQVVPSEEKLEIKGSKIIDFQGEKVLLQEGLTEKDFTNYSQFARESEKYLKSNIKSSDFKRSLSNISMEEILGFIQEGMKQYPFSKEDFSEEQLEKIYKDIPSIGNKQDAQSKKSVISDYYNVLLIKYLDKKIENYLKKGKKFDILEQNGTEFEKQLAWQDPVAAQCFGGAGRSQAESMTTSVFGCYGPDSKQLNAFKHSSWNALGIQELVQLTRNKWTSLDRIKVFACAHEYIDVNGTWVLPDDGSTAMDLHNNLVGRTYMYNQITTFLGVAGNIPSNGNIQNHLSGLNYVKKGSASEIMQLSSSYSYYNLGHIYDAMNYHTPTQGTLVYILEGRNPNEMPYNCNDEELIR